MLFEKEDCVQAPVRLTCLEKEERAVAGTFVISVSWEYVKKGQEVIPFFVVGGNVHGQHICQCMVRRSVSPFEDSMGWNDKTTSQK